MASTVKYFCLVFCLFMFTSSSFLTCACYLDDGANENGGSRANPSKDGASRGANGGSNCATCSISLGLVYQLAEIHNETVTKALERLCTYMPDQFKQACDVLADFLGPFLVQVVPERDTPDVVCTAIGFCRTDPGHQTCRIWPKPKMDFDAAVGMREMIVKKLKRTRPVDPKICNLPGIKEICMWFKKIFSYHDAAFDDDQDDYSKVETLRGYSWRGADCNDLNEYYHPGARPMNSDVTDDSNCNGIYGSDPVSKRPYEDVFCKGTEPRGVVVLGDSISAHFHLPEEWLDSKKLSAKVFEHLPFILENEIDWPELSAITGFAKNNSWPEVINGPMDSIYKRMFERNRCNHRDYQNIAVNGARTASMADDIMYSLRRDNVRDYPIFLFYGLVGNDVCNGHPDTFAHMTTPQEMHDNAMKTMKYLDKLLPNNSYVMISGLADGRVLYNSLHDRIHPIGRLHNDVTYPDVYSYLNCLEVSPCTGWMNSNETIRNMTTAKAVELSNVLKNIVANGSMFSNIRLYYSDCPQNQMFEYWEKQGGQAWELIEPVDGFHSNQQGQAVTAKVMWNNLLKQFPEIIGNVNPNNDKIQQTFGDQGGYRP